MSIYENVKKECPLCHEHKTLDELEATRYRLKKTKYVEKYKFICTKCIDKILYHK